MEYAEEKPWVTPSKASPLPVGTGAGEQLSELMEVECNI